jgi:hypothetical protein
LEKDLEMEEKGNISDSEDHAGDNPKEKHAAGETGTESMAEDMAIDVKDKPNQEATDNMDTRKEDLPNQGVCCKNTTAHGR